MTDSTAISDTEPLRILIWIAEGTWQAAVNAARRLAPADARITLLHVTAEDIEDAAHGAYAGLLGRGHRDADPGKRIGELAVTSAHALLDLAARQLGRPCSQIEVRGSPRKKVAEASGGADLLILARDGDHAHPGPRSLGPETRYAVDHALCAVLVVWPEPGTRPIARPEHGPRPPHRRHRPGPHDR